MLKNVYRDVDTLLQDKAANLSSEVKTIITSAIKSSKQRESSLLSPKEIED